MKKFTAIFSIIIITAFIGGALSYVRAAYIEPAGQAPGNNVPSPVLTNNVDNSAGFPGFFKVGKLGTTKDKTNKPVDANQFTNSTMVAMGQTSADSLTSTYYNRIRAELDSNSALYALMFGDPTNSTFMQVNPGDSSPRTFKVVNHTRAPRMVIGSKTAPGDAYTVYLAPGSNATNLGKSRDYSTYSGDYKPNNRNFFCTLTEANLKDKGCPPGTYLGQIIPFADSNGVVAACYDLIYKGGYFYPYKNFNKGACTY